MVNELMISQASLPEIVLECLVAANAADIVVIDTSGLTVSADAMIVCTGNTSRHLDAIATQVRKRCKALVSTIGVEHDSNWVLIDLQAVVVHIMLPAARAVYKLEELWASAAS